MRCLAQMVDLDVLWGYTEMQKSAMQYLRRAETIGVFVREEDEGFIH